MGKSGAGELQEAPVESEEESRTRDTAHHTDVSTL
jgi:hypothetical protein